MNNIDDIIRAKAKSESLLLPEGFEERNDILITRLAAHSKTPKKLLKNTRYYKLSVAVALIVLLLAGAAAAAYSLSGGDFFKQLFIDKKNNDAVKNHNHINTKQLDNMGSSPVGTVVDTDEGGDFFKQFFIDKANNDVVKNHSHMNTEQLDNIASSTVGTVIDTDKITIDVMGVIISGNTAEIMLKVTAKQLDTVLYNTGIGPLNNYRFNDDLGGSLSGDNETTSIRYYYSDEDKSLAPNQFKILYTLITKSNFNKDQYSIKLSKFGYFTLGDGTSTTFKSIYDDSWQFIVAFDSKSDSSENIDINKQITAGRYSFILNKVNITPLACTITLKCDQTNEFINRNLNKIYSDFINGIKDCSLTLKDGTKLSSESFTMIPSGGEEGFILVLSFNVPVTVDDISSMTILGVEIPIN